MIKEKSGIFLLLAFLFLTFASCEKLKDLTKFDVQMNLPAQNFTLNKPAVKNSHAPVDLFYDFSVSINLDSIKQAHGLSSFGIENGKITKALLTLTSPENATLGFLISARLVYFEATGGETLVAHTGNISPDAKSVELILDAVDLTTFIKNKNFNGRIYLSVDPALMPPTADFSLSETIKFTVNPL
ncbi:MAG: hypothetical protein ACP5O2_00190 [Bacteroidales bacterium]